MGEIRFTVAETGASLTRGYLYLTENFLKEMRTRNPETPWVSPMKITSIDEYGHIQFEKISHPVDVFALLSVMYVLNGIIKENSKMSYQTYIDSLANNTFSNNYEKIEWDIRGESIHEHISHYSLQHGRVWINNDPIPLVFVKRKPKKERTLEWYLSRDGTILVSSDDERYANGAEKSRLCVWIPKKERVEEINPHIIKVALTELAMFYLEKKGAPMDAKELLRTMGLDRHIITWLKL